MASITKSEQQLETWANHVQLNKNVETYKKVKSIFQGATFNDSHNFEIYLQGSIANNTNIRADGDIDIVLQFNNVFCSNAKEKLTNDDYIKFSGKYPDSAYTQKDLRNDIKSRLGQNHIDYKEKTKCFKLYLKGEHWQDVDLIPCFQYRNYNYSDEYQEGIKILTSKNETIINYPKLHKENGEQKNQAAGNYKKVVRIFKNIKKRLVDEWSFDEKLATSYFIECLLYNVPDEKFNGNNFTSILCNCINWITENNFQNIQNLKCQNGITDLFGGENTQWNLENCKKFINQVIEYITKEN